jgi:hypothetical protein
LFILVTAIDFGFYVYFGEHINILLFDFFDDDALALVKTIIVDLRFYIVLLVLISVYVVIYKIVSMTTRELLNLHIIINFSFLNTFTKVCVVLFIPLLIFLTARGTVSMFPLGKFHAQISSNSFINNTALTAVHSLSDAIQAKIEQSNDKINIVEKVGLSEKDIDLSIFNKTSIKKRI